MAASPAQAVILPNNFKSVGYMPSWSGSVNSIQFGKLTHINYAFANPNSNGTLQPVDNPAKLSSLVSLAHSNNVSGTGAQVWQVQANGTLRNPQSNKCLDATGVSSADGTRLQIWDCFGGSNQVWTLP